MTLGAPHPAGRHLGGPGLFRLLVESVIDYAIFALAPDGTILTWNEGAQRIKGYSADEIIGKHIRQFYPAEDRDEGKPEKLLQRAEADGRVEDAGWRLRKDGSRFWASVIITALRDEDGRLVGFAKVTRDLTERREAEEALRLSEERLRLILHSVKDYGIFMLDPKGIVISWNEGAERIKGYEARDIIGKHFSMFYTEEDLKWDKPGMELRVAAEEGRFEDEGWRKRKDGSLFWANVIITAVRDNSGKLLGFAKVTRDLSERRASHERAIADARRIAAAEASSRAKTDFLAAMSHELRTPLNAIGGYAELLEMGVGGANLNPQQADYLQRVRTAQQHLLALINDLLNYSRIEAGQVEYDMGPVGVHPVVNKVVQLIEVQAAKKSIRIGHDECSTEILALADRVKVEQIVLNLLSNAVKFTPPGGTIEVRCAETAGRTLVIIEDTGPGIPDDQRESIFEPFVQLGRSLTSRQEGTGLGLAISRDLARAMDGDIVVSRSPLGGAMFTLSLRTA
ncbi:MAG TPA: PAS domain-containing sensor histidine kinase [Gemmatimonadaceae bacterium]|nr:PAS domain-containing sensor histidine kinase [Gemmatimonadaceae bacterium]